MVVGAEDPSAVVDDDAIAAPARLADPSNDAGVRRQDGVPAVAGEVQALVVLRGLGEVVGAQQAEAGGDD